MKKSVLVSLIIAGIIIVGIFSGAALVMLGGDDSDNQVSNTTSPVTTTMRNSNDDVANSDAQESVSTQESSSETCGDKGQSCTTEEIAMHNAASDCWVIYDGNYYDVTSYVREHEGGSAVFNDETCGQDIQKYLEGTASSAGRQNQHGSSAYRDLEQYLVGPVEN